MFTTGRICSSLSKEILCMGHGGLETHPTTGRLQIRQLVLSSLMSIDTNIFFCADRDFNRAMLSGLVVEKRTRLLLEIPMGERDYRVVLS